MVIPSARILRALNGSAQVTACYFGDLAATGCLRFYCGGRLGVQCIIWGQHTIIGPPSATAGTGRTATAKNVATTPMVRIAILIVRFMGLFLLACPRSCTRKGATCADTHYTAHVKPRVQIISPHLRPPFPKPAFLLPIGSYNII